MKPRTCIIKTDGTNCDYETAHAFAVAGAETETVLLTTLLKNKTLLSSFQILVLPGGFSYGDDIASGKVLAVELHSFLRDQLQQFIADKKLILGICNGFQVLVRAGLLPNTEAMQQQVTLTNNVSGSFVCRWVDTEIPTTNCIFTQNLPPVISLPVAHAEGNFFAPQEQLDDLESHHQVALRYTASTNPNGSRNHIAGISDKTGHVLGLMPHPERFIYSYQHPLHTRSNVEPMGIKMIRNAVKYFQ